MQWKTTRFDIDLSRPQVMGIVNVTPDSFSDGGAHDTTKAALQHCEALLRDGADMLDIGGESTRPGADPLSLADELARVLPVVREAVKLVNGRLWLEASGGITIDTIKDVAATGVNAISVGALTHSSRALDLGMDFY